MEGAKPTRFTHCTPSLSMAAGLESAPFGEGDGVIHLALEQFPTDEDFSSFGFRIFRPHIGQDHRAVIDAKPMWMGKGSVSCSRRMRR